MMISECLALVWATPPAAKASLTNNRVRRSTASIFHCTIPPPPRSVMDKLTYSLDYTDPSGGSYGQQPRYQTGYAAADTGGLDSGKQRSDDLGQGRAGAGTTWDPSNTSDQYGGSQRTASGQTGGYTDPASTGRTWQGDPDDDTAGYGGGGKPSVTSKVKGTSLLVWGCVGAR